MAVQVLQQMVHAVAVGVEPAGEEAAGVGRPQQGAEDDDDRDADQVLQDALLRVAGDGHTEDEHGADEHLWTGSAVDAQQQAGEVSDAHHDGQGEGGHGKPAQGDRRDAHPQQDAAQTVEPQPRRPQRDPGQGEHRRQHGGDRGPRSLIRCACGRERAWLLS
ncbi:hypothetical protein ACFU6S_07430 [Streptomyces sp. NPDC057456]|uniref:hypothetical protein n=1 Tax=Streptomyces sp. NPDC057456 TaxID=3346139 RepID=UPI003678EC57